ncbi:hypothetical protein EK904_009708 [Melospiza melodia maxima]|nr:hypothetical protein EK904_009708 [Melospiza melodia maxima]
MAASATHTAAGLSPGSILLQHERVSAFAQGWQGVSLQKAWQCHSTGLTCSVLLCCCTWFSCGSDRFGSIQVKRQQESKAGHTVWLSSNLAESFPPLPSSIYPYQMVDPGAFFFLASDLDGIPGFSLCQVGHNAQQLPEILALGQRKQSWNLSANAVRIWSAPQLLTVPICRVPHAYSNEETASARRNLRKLLRGST